MKNFLPIVLFGFTGAVFASQITVEFTGPGGHSYGNYGNTNALHAASRAIMEIEKTVPHADVVDLNGGATVNAIAADASFKVILSGSEQQQKADLLKIRHAVKEGVQAENQFREVHYGQLNNGVPAEVKFHIKVEAAKPNK